MKVSIITMQFPAPSETFAARDCRALIAAGVDLQIHCLRPAHPDSAALADSFNVTGLNVTYSRFGTLPRGFWLMMRHPVEALRFAAAVMHRERGNWSHITKAIAIMPRIYEIVADLSEEHCDVVHCFWGHYPSLVLELLDRRNHPALRSLFLGSYDLVSALNTSVDVAHSAQTIFTHARANLPDFAQAGIDPERVTIAYRGIDVSAMDTALSDTPERDIDIITVCRIIPGKGVQRLLRAIGELVAQGYRPKVVIAGDGSHKQDMIRLAKELGIDAYVSFPGFVPISEIFDLLQRAKVFSLLSNEPNDRLPNSVKEAMYLGCKCIVGESIGIEELVRTPDHGLVVYDYDPVVIAAHVKTLLADPGQSDRIARVREYIATEFNATRSMQIYLAEWDASSKGLSQ